MLRTIKNKILFVAAIAVVAMSAQASVQIPDNIGLKDIYANHFPYVGTAYQWRVNGLTDPDYQALLLREFNSVTHEDDFKPDQTMLQAGSTDDDIRVQLNQNARRVLQFAVDNNLGVRGHVLIWHQQMPQWFFRANMQSNENTLASMEVMNRRMRSYINNMFAFIKQEFPTVDLYAYDVVNEVFLDNGNAREPENSFNTSNSHSSIWVRIYGDNRFVDSAFVYAAAARDLHFPNMKLFYNDYNEYHPDGKVAAMVALANRLGPNGRGVMDGLGMQSHLATGWPSRTQYRNALTAFAGTGIEIQVTELDITIDNVTLNPGPTQQQLETQANKYREVFEELLAAKEAGANITSVTFWGVTDDRSWRGPTASEQDRNFPLLFDANFQRKPAYFAIAGLIPEEDWGDGNVRPIGFQLTTPLPSGGTITRTPNKGFYAEGEEVTLTAVPNTGFEFKGWTGDIGTATATAASITIAMDADKTISATFELALTGDNLIRDGTFENMIGTSGSTSTDWVLNRWGDNESGDNPDFATFTMNDDGSVSVNVLVVRPDPWDIQLVQEGLPLYKGYTYEVSFDIESSVEREVVAMCQLKVSPWSGYFDTTLALAAGTLQNVKFEFTMDYDDDDDARFGFNIGQATGNVTIGNVSMVLVRTGDDGIDDRCPGVGQVWSDEEGGCVTSIRHASRNRNVHDMRVTARRNNVNVRFRAPQTGSTELRLYSVNGRLVSRSTLQTVEGRNYNHRMTTGRLPSGVYVVAVVGAGGGREVMRERVVVR